MFNGSPTTQAAISYSFAHDSTAVMSSDRFPDAASVANGEASEAPGSLTASPMRFEPWSMPRNRGMVGNLNRNLQCQVAVKTKVQSSKKRVHALHPSSLDFELRTSH